VVSEKLSQYLSRLPWDREELVMQTAQERAVAEGTANAKALKQKPKGVQGGWDSCCRASE
jgi:hypothetical protein